MPEACYVTDMTNHTIPAPGDLRVSVVAGPGQVVDLSPRDARQADDIRQFSTASNVIARTHGDGGTFPSDAYIERFNGRTWEIVPVVTESCPWRVVTLDGVFRFKTRRMAAQFAGPGEIIEFAPDVELVR